MWTQAEAIALCRMVELVAPAFGCHVALTGGLLYKEGTRKDCDLVFYRIRQVEKIDVAGLCTALSRLGIGVKSPEPSWCIKASFDGKPIDCFFPEQAGGDYPEKESP